MFYGKIAVLGIQLLIYLFQLFEHTANLLDLL